MQQHESDLAGRIRWSAIGVAAVATFGIAGIAAAGSEPPAPAGDEPVLAVDYDSCPRDGSTAADRIETRALTCRAEVEALLADPEFMACIHSAAKTPDSIERWFEPCRLATQP
jgi:hypothetical protein